MQDDERVREERKKAKKNRDKYVGLDADNMRSKFKSSMSFNDGFGSNKSASSFRDDDLDRDSYSSAKNDFSSKVKNAFDNSPNKKNDFYGASDFIEDDNSHSASSKDYSSIHTDSKAANREDITSVSSLNSLFI